MSRFKNAAEMERHLRENPTELRSGAQQGFLHGHAGRKQPVQIATWMPQIRPRRSKGRGPNA